MVKQTIQIFARLKPTKKTTSVYSVDNEEQTGASLEFMVPKDLADGFVNNKRETYKFWFQSVFDQKVHQEQIFENIAKPVADNVLDGYNGTIFAYGQTASGKTFTITGGAERYSDRGIIPRTLSYLYERFSQNSSMVYTTHISYLEIYNEVGYDLLDPRHEASHLEDLPKVSIMEDQDQNVHLRNLSLQQSTNEEEALNLLFLGDTNRMIAETPMNQASTRSHCIFTVHLCGREPGSATVRRSKLHLVDLAGSERVGKAGVGGHHFTEAKYINLSLHYLEQVIIALSEKNRSHIPYRNSMMTSVLRDSLGGNCMTTMIATISLDRRDVDESISTCRFAQRVALIKNDALLNEELDPTLLIARLKRDIQCLKEELSMVTGQQREDQLTPEETQKLEEQIKVYLDDPDPEATLTLGPDMRKIQFCFSLLKVTIRDRTGDGSVAAGERKPAAAPATAPAATTTLDTESRPNSPNLARLKEMLAQRDNEINILVNILKKERKRAQDVADRLASMGSSHGRASQNPSASPRTSWMEEGSSDATVSKSEGPIAHQRKRGSQLSIGKQEAFEIFRRDHEDRLTIEDNKAVLKQRFNEAKALGEQVNETRRSVNELKKQLERRRLQRAVHGVIGDYTEVEEMDPVEESLRKQIEELKNNYKSAFGRLKALKTEIEHLQLLLEKAKVKLQKDFQEWWRRESSGPQVLDSEDATRRRTQRRGPNLQPSVPSILDSYARSLSCSVSDFPPSDPLHEFPAPSATDLRSFARKSPPPWTNPAAPRPSIEDAGEGAFTPSSQLRTLSVAEISSLPSIPLTGDQQTDADILAFVRARQKLDYASNAYFH